MSVQSPVEVFIRPEALSLATDLDTWLLSIKAKIGTRILENLNLDTSGLDRYIEFAEIKELPGAFIACSFYQNDINDALTRAGIFMGAGKGMKEKTVARHRDFPLVNYKKLVAGHNLPGPVVRDFFTTIQQSQDPETQANPAELAVAEYFLKSPRLASLQDAFYLIGFSIQTMKDQKGVISHEVFHAYSFLNSNYRDIVSNFWRDVVSDEDKILITKQIGLAYNIDNEDLVIDEFQAYLIQTRAEQDRMKAFVPKYRSLLIERINHAKIQIVPI